MKRNGILFGRKVDKFHSPFEGHHSIRGLLRSPQSEQEAIILFSTLTEHLQMKILYVGTRYPDAGIQVKENGRWITKYAEFELYSSRFQDHIDKYRKDNSTCDMIICWEHDWDKCPPQLEVIELKEKLQSFM